MRLASHTGMLPRVSIVTISFNQVGFLEEAIKSVLNQGYPNLEYIVADGGSTDGSDAIINRYRPRLAQALVGRDAGPADALNKGFAHATGDILGFLNSDDTLLPGAIQVVSDFMTQNPTVDFLSGHCLITDAGGRVLRKSYSDAFSLRRMAYAGCILMQPATFFRRGIFARTNGFSIENKLSWDAELFLAFGMKGAKHAVVEQFLATYRLHEASITGANTVETKRQAIRDRNLVQYLGRNLGASDSFWRFYYRYLRKFTNPRDTWQRIIGGPIGGRFPGKKK